MLGWFRKKLPPPAGGSAETKEDAGRTGPYAPAAPSNEPQTLAPSLAGASGLPAVPGYEVLELLGRGGMGVVYRARQTSLKRVVALKMIRPGSGATPDALARFRTEAEAIARLAHPHIVQVFEVGEHEGLPYFSLEFVGGGNLGDYLAGMPQPARDAAVLAEVLARAVAAAHEAGIVHRDLKPANVLLQNRARMNTDSADLRGSEEDPSLVRADPLNPRSSASHLFPKIADFGLAKRLDEDSGQTQAGQVMGTPSYMAPEQAEGRVDQVGPRVDVYALGAILYEMLTGRPPFRGATILDTLEQVRKQEPVLPRLLNNRVPRDLETICLKAMAKEPARRYPSASALADDLQRFLRGEPIRARPSTAWERGVKWARRHPAPASLLAVSVLSLLTILGVVVEYNVRLGNALRQETQAREEAETRLEQSVRSEYATRLMLVANLWKPDPVTGRRLLEDPEQFPPRLRDFTWGYFHRLCDRELAPLRGHPDSKAATGQPTATWYHATVVRCSPDGRTLASGSTDRTVRLWDLASGQERATLKGHADRVTFLTFSGDGTLLASAGEDRTVKLWDVATGKERATLKGHGDRVAGVAFVADGKVVATAGHDHTVRWWDAATGTEKSRVKFPAELLANTCMALSPDGRLLAACRYTNRPTRLVFYDTATAREAFAVELGIEAVFVLTFSPDGRFLAATGNTYIGLVNLHEKRQQAVLAPRMAGGSQSAAFSPDGRTVAVAGAIGDDGTSAVKLWDAASGEQVGILRDPSPGISSVAFAGSRLAFSSSDGTIKVWDRTGSPEGATLGPHPEGVWAVAFSPDGRALASASGEWSKENTPSEVRLWSAVTGERLGLLRGHAGHVTSAVFSPDGKTIATASWDQTVHLLDRATGTLERTLTGSPAILWALAYSPDGATLASASGDPKKRDRPGEVRLWDTQTGTVRAALSGHEGGVFCLAYSPDGRTLATGSWDGTVRLWDAASGQEQAVLRGEGEVWCVAFSPDGGTLASGTGDLGHRTIPGEVRLWDLPTRQVRIRLKGHTGGVFSAAYTPDGKTLATGGNDGAVKLWDPRTGQERASLPGHTRWVRSVAFSPDGGLLASGSGDGTVKLWDARRRNRGE